MHKLHPVFVLLAVLLAGLPAAGAAEGPAPYRWQNVAIGGGGFVTGLSFHPRERGLAYARYMRLRHPAAFGHRTLVVDGVGHDGAGMFASPEGVAALFGGKRRAQ